MSKNLSIGTKAQYQDRPNIPTSKKLLFSEVNEMVSFINTPVQSLGTFSGTLVTLDGTGVYTDKTLAANTEITFAESGHEEGNAHLVLITTDGSYTLTFTKPIAYNLYLDSSLTNGGTLASGTYLFSFVFVGGSIKIGYTTMSSVAGDVTAPTITSIVVDADNGGVTVNFSEGCYANNDQTGDLVVADFTAGLAGGTATSPVLSNPVHTAGGSSIDFDLAYTGTADGGETLTITVVDNSVYDQSGNVMASGQNGTDLLNDQTAPVFSNVSVDNLAATTADFNAQLNEAGTIFWAVFPTATAQQTKAVIEAGTGAVDFGSIVTAGSTIETAGITGLTAETAYKVHYFGRDSTSNESAATLTSEFTTSSASIIVMQDDFAGTTIDTNKWTETDTAADAVEVTQNNQLIFTIDNTGATTGANDNKVESVSTIVNGCAQITVAGTAQVTDSACFIQLRNSDQYRAFIFLEAGNKTGLVIYHNGSQVYSLLTSVDFKNTWRIRFDTAADNVYFEYLSAPDTWTQVGTTQNYDISNGGGNLITSIAVTCKNSGAGSDTLTFDNFYLTNDTYSTSVPI